MPIYIEISKLYRCATVVARGKITSAEIMAAAKELIEADIPLFAKLVDVAGSYQQDKNGGPIGVIDDTGRLIGRLEAGQILARIGAAGAMGARHV